MQIVTGGKSPIYRQVVDQVRSGIAAGKLTVGDPLPSVRGLAAELVVNPNTIAKAYSILVSEGAVESHQGRGFFVAEQRNIYTKAERLRRLEEALRPAIAEALSLGFDEQELLAQTSKHFHRLTKA
ncbi:GntR family transcriptional regulator [Roseiconus nitratireducens]|uniref:GntR family transcriptional regulator n=1 Tax=Roseiconus nitratireducens TaxID=2605748 RepID=A0A5M6D8Q4_9BACT|nr:GntR family transcriptional regulator [Roseiconus nitratireducens]